MWLYIYSCSIQYGYIQFTVCQFHFWFWVCHPTYLASPPASCHFRSYRYAFSYMVICVSYGYMCPHLSHLWNPRTGLGKNLRTYRLISRQYHSQARVFHTWVMCSRKAISPVHEEEKGEKNRKWGSLSVTPRVWIPWMPLGSLAVGTLW